MDRSVRWGNRSQRWLVFAGAVVILGLVGVSRKVSDNREGAAAVQSSPADTLAAEPGTRPPQPVTTVAARRGMIVRNVSVAGIVRAETEAQLAARLPAQIVAVMAHEGDRVRRGQVLVVLDDQDARAALEAAEAGVSAAAAVLAKAESGATVRSAEVTTGVAGAEAAVQAARVKREQARAAAEAAAAEAAAELRRAEAGLDAARAGSAAAQRGPRPEQLRQAETAVAQAEAAARAARRGLDEAQFLHDRGGLTRAQLDEARLAEETTRAQLEAARAGRDLVRQGAMPEERQSAAAAVRQAEAGVEAARAGQRRAGLAKQEVAAADAQVRQAEAGLAAARAGHAGREVAKADVRAAEAGLTQARVQRRQAQEQLAATRLLSPAAGVLTRRAGEPGQFAQPGQPLVTIASGDRFFEAPVSASAVPLLRAGQPVSLSTDAAPGRRFGAVLRQVPLIPGPDGRSYLLRADLGPAALAPGVRARGHVQVARVDDAMLVPSTAVQRRGGETILWVARGGRAERRRVELGVETDTDVQILSPVRLGEAIIVSGADGLRPGDPVDAGGQPPSTQRRSDGAFVTRFRFRNFGAQTPHPKSKIQNPESKIAKGVPPWA